MIHHAARGMHKFGIHTHRLIHHAATYYARNPDKLIQHGATAVSYGGVAVKVTGKAAAHIGKLTWTHGPRVAKHTSKFMVKAALKSFKLFSGSRST